jgi:aminopeptidase-like protein
MHRLIEELYPICRSITGEGVRQTLRRIGKDIPLELREVSSGTEVFDWTVPDEWNIRDAWIKDPQGRRIVDFRSSNLHVLNYSVPIRACLTREELRPHLETLPDHPDWIPYRTSYYSRKWGFCLSYNTLASIGEGPFEVCIDSSLEPGSLTYGECLLPGASTDEVLVSSHICHPSLANDNLSGVAIAVALAQQLMHEPRRLTYRFLFAPGTIGAITWLALNREASARVRAGLVLTCVGDSGAFHYKKSRRGNALIDRAAAHVLKHSSISNEILEFEPYGYDERQYCSPGFNLPVGCLMRSVHGTFPEYHSSADNLDFVTPRSLEETLRVCLQMMTVVENDRVFVNQKPHCEPQLGKRGLYKSTGGDAGRLHNLAMLWVLNLSDGDHTLLDIAERSGLPFSILLKAAEDLLCTDLLV